MDIEMTARVAVSSAIYAIDMPYEYKIPSVLTKKLRPGMRVIVPFGRGNRKCEAFVLRLTPLGDGEKLKAIDCLLDNEPVLSNGQIKLGLWMRERFFCAVYEALRGMLPAGIWYKIKHVYALSDGVSIQSARYVSAASSAALRVLDVLEEYAGAAELETIKDIVGAQTAATGLRWLSGQKLIREETLEQQKVRDKTTQSASLAIPAVEAAELAVRKKKAAPNQAAVLQLLSQVGEAEVKELCYFTGASRASVKKLAEAGYIRLQTMEEFRRPDVPHGADTQTGTLTAEQKDAFDGIIRLIENKEASVALLHGITGSGKTAVYMQVIERTIAAGKTAIFLVPEISLTPQLAGIFVARFGDRVAVLHSALSMGERYDEWKRVKSGAATVVVGTRSAIFAPVSNLGLIVIDEEQEYTYKSETSPRYHARDVAKYLCHQSGALLLLGSATPAVDSMYSAREGVYHYFSLKTRYNQMDLPKVIIADMKKNLRQGNSTVISTELKGEIEQNLQLGEQTILFINRRGTSSLIACGECGHNQTCPRCSVSLTYHADNDRLMCHYCGYSERLAVECPQCGGLFKHIGAGTQKVVQQLGEAFPDTPVLRMDTDTVSRKNSHEAILKRFADDKVPILVGTQMVTKGLDFENVTLVGVISADQSLYISDYRAQEKTFSQITQVVGRAGRGQKKGRAVIQTYTPRNEVIELASRQDYDGFYENEIQMRRVLDCPPINDLIYIMVSGIIESTVLSCCSYIRRGLEIYLRPREDVTVLGPAPAAVTKINNRFRYKVTLKCKNDKIIRETVSHIIRQASRKKEFRRVAIYGDLGSNE